MAYSIIHLENLIELKTRSGGSVTPSLATILGLNYPTVEAFAVYVWDNTSTVVGDDVEIVVPTSRINSNGRWFRVDLSVAPHTHPINQISGLQAALDAKIEQEGDPTVEQFIKDITEANIANWSQAFVWGNHAGLYKSASYVPSFAELTGVPSMFAPSAHTHALADVTGLIAALNDKQPTGNYLTSISATLIQEALGYNPYSSLNPAGYITLSQVPAQVRSDWNATIGPGVIENKPTIPAAQVPSDWAATTGVTRILNKPTIPDAQIPADWNASAGVARILNKPTIPVLPTYYNTTAAKTAPTKIFSERIAVTSSAMTINLISAGFSSTTNLVATIAVERLGAAATDGITKKIRSLSTTQLIVDLYQPLAIVIGGLGIGPLTTFTNTWIHVHVEGN